MDMVYIFNRNKCMWSSSPIVPTVVMGIGNIFKIDDRYINIDR